MKIKVCKSNSKEEFYKEVESDLLDRKDEVVHYGIASMMYWYKNNRYYGVLEYSNKHNKHTVTISKIVLDTVYKNKMQNGIQY